MGTKKKKEARDMLKAALEEQRKTEERTDRRVEHDKEWAKSKYRLSTINSEIRQDMKRLGFTAEIFDDGRNTVFERDLSTEIVWIVLAPASYPDERRAYHIPRRGWDLVDVVIYNLEEHEEMFRSRMRLDSFISLNS